MLINLSNHPSDHWEKLQIEAAKEYGELVDIAFPAIAPRADEVYIHDIATVYLQQVVAILSSTDGSNNAVHLMGEMTFCYVLINLLHDLNIPVLASTSERKATTTANGYKESHFEFIRFRAYTKL